MAEVGSAFLTIIPSLRGLRRALEDGGRDAQGAGDGVGRQFGNGIVGSLASIAGPIAGIFAGLAVTDYLKGAVEQASDLSESMNVVSLTFKESAGSLESFFKGSATSLGLTEAAARQAASNIGGLLNNMGFTREASAETSKSILTLGADLGSAFNADPAQAVEAIGAALRGETEPIRAFNVSINDAAIKAKALELGLYSGTGALDANAKAQATLALITQQTADVQGDFANTSTGLANAQRISAAGLGNLAGVIGSAFLPAVTAGANSFNSTLLPALTSFAEVAAPAVAGAITKVLTGIQGLTDIIVKGDFTTAFREAFNLEEDSGAVNVLFGIRDALLLVRTGAQGVYDILVGGDFTGAFARAFSINEDSGVVTFLFTLREQVLAFFAQIQQLGDGRFGSIFQPVADGFASLGAPIAALGPQLVSTVLQFSPLLIALQALLPVLPVVAISLGQVAAVLAGALVAALPAVLQLAGTLGGVLVQAVTGLVPVINSLVPILGTALVVAVQTLAPIIVGLVGALGSLLEFIAPAAPVILTLVAALKVWAAIQGVLNVVLLANPIGLVVVAIAALIGAVVLAYQNSETFRDIVQAAWEGVQAAIGAVVEFVTGTVVPAIVSAWQSITSGVQSFVASVVERFNAFREGITQAVEAVKAAVLSRIIAIIATAGQIAAWVISVVAYFTNLRTQAIAKVAELVAYVATMPGLLKAAIGDLASKFVSVGSDIIAGIVKGIKGGIASVGSAARDVANSALKAAKGALGIASPSKKFIEIGEFINEGLAEGITGTADQVKSATDKLADNVYAGFNENAAAEYEKFLKTNTEAVDGIKAQVAGIRSGLDDRQREVNRLKEQARDEIASLSGSNKAREREISAARDQARKEIDALSGDAKAKERNAKRIKALNAKIKGLDEQSGNDKDKNAVRIEALNAQIEALDDEALKAKELGLDRIKELDLQIDELNNKRAVFKDQGEAAALTQAQGLLERIKSQTAQLAQIAVERDAVAVELKAAQDKLADAIKLRDDFAGSVANSATQIASLATLSQENDGVFTAQTLISGLKNGLTAIETFQKQLAKLRQQGVSDDIYKQIVDAGVEKGSGLAQAIIDGGPKVVAQMNALQAQVTDRAKALGLTTATALYQAGVDGAQGLVDGINSRSEQLAQAARALAQILTEEVKRALGIASPSKVFKRLGGFVGQGFVEGIEGMKTAVATAADDLVAVPSVPKPVVPAVSSPRYLGSLSASGGAGDLSATLLAEQNAILRTQNELLEKQAGVTSDAIRSGFRDQASTVRALNRSGVR